MAKVIDLDHVPEAEFLRRFGPPEFVGVDPAHRPAVLAVIDDSAGVPWAFVDMAALRPDFLFYAGRAARVQRSAAGLVIAIRAEFADHPSERWRFDAGDARVLRKREWDAAHPGLLSEALRQDRRCNLAVELPGRAASITLAER